MNKLSQEKAQALLSPDGPLAKKIPNFESRPEQLQMMQNIVDAYNHNKVALIEAGTGTGKSFAYIIPAILWALENKQRTVISTNTIQLQEQLLHKDIPLMLDALGVKIRVVLAKGMNNYVCLRKMEDAQKEKGAMPCNEKGEFQAIEEWMDQTHDGSKATLPFVPSRNTWEKVGAEHDLCTGAKCPHKKECFFYKAREEAQEAQILIVNHHLLFADLAVRAETDNYDKPAILPEYQRLVLDEAHNIEDIATDFLGNRLTRIGLLRHIGRLISIKEGQPSGKFPQLAQLIQKYTTGDPDRQRASILERLRIDLPGMSEALSTRTKFTFDTFAEFSGNFTEVEDAREKKLRLLPLHKTNTRWKEEVFPQANQLVIDLKRFNQAIAQLDKDILYLDDEALDQATKVVRSEMLAFSERLHTSAQALKEFITEEIPQDKVQWIESRPFKKVVNAHVVDASLDVSEILVKFLFDKIPTVTLCSATLASGKQFSFFRNRIGLTETLAPTLSVTEAIYNSPFNYQKQALLAIPQDMPPPDHKEFLQKAADNIWEAVRASYGNAFVLFTSYSMMLKVYNLLHKKLSNNRYTLLMQGEDNRQQLIKRFKAEKKAVLFGTDSFWEGVDVAGEDLRCVVIVKLPFKVPSEPIIQARTEAIRERGGKPFYEYSVPQALVKFKQGFGRLIRHKRDRGCIVILDSRIIQKSYGNLFVKALPPCQQTVVPSSALHETLTQFFRSTYYLTKQL